jgi:hypothetical protein
MSTISTSATNPSIYSTLKICSLNCRSLIKLVNPTLNYDILCLQETHATTTDIQNTLNLRFQPHDTHWSNHCGIVSLNPLTELQPPTLAEEGRVMAYQVSHQNQLFLLL